MEISVPVQEPQFSWLLIDRDRDRDEVRRVGLELETHDVDIRVVLYWLYTQNATHAPQKRHYAG